MSSKKKNELYFDCKRMRTNRIRRFSQINDSDAVATVEKTFATNDIQSGLKTKIMLKNLIKFKIPFRPNTF